MVNQASEYALRAVVFLGMRRSSDPASASDISARTMVSLPYLQKVLRLLTKAGILTAQRGAGGGFKLAKPTEQITVLEVLKACDSAPQRIERCPLGISGHTRLCPLHSMLDQQVAGVEKVFASTTINDLLETKSEVLPLCQKPEGKKLGVKKPRVDGPPLPDP